MVWETLLFKKSSIPEPGLCYRTRELLELRGSRRHPALPWVLLTQLGLCCSGVQPEEASHPPRAGRGALELQVALDIGSFTTYRSGEPCPVPSGAFQLQGGPRGTVPRCGVPCGLD